jgi:pimeloyl-ACP methyl ester carboxylesterase
MGIVCAGLIRITVRAFQSSEAGMATFVVAHGAWSAGFVWKKMHPLMRANGHTLVAPTQTGLGERVHLASPDVTLSTHIEDLLQVLFHEDLKDVHLIGHSYGGIVATGVADRAPERLAQIIYLDAFIPRDGTNMLELATPESRRRWIEGAEQTGEGWRVPSNPLPPDTSTEDVAWITPRRHPQPLKSMTELLRLTRGETTLPRAYIYCTRFGPGDMFGPYARQAKADPKWRYFEMDTSHSPHVTAPETLASILDELSKLS